MIEAHFRYSSCTRTLSSFLISLRKYSRSSSSFCGSGACERWVWMPYLTESSFSRLSEKLSSCNKISSISPHYCPETGWWASRVHDAQSSDHVTRLDWRSSISERELVLVSLSPTPGTGPGWERQVCNWYATYKHFTHSAAKTLPPRGNSLGNKRAKCVELLTIKTLINKNCFYVPNYVIKFIFNCINNHGDTFAGWFVSKHLDNVHFNKFKQSKVRK